jgi:NADH-quinone oxidoreductase subunit C
MTRSLTGPELAEALERGVPGAVEDARAAWVVLRPEHLVEAMRFLRDDPETMLTQLSALTGVDYEDHFAVVYHLLSIQLNVDAVVKILVREHEQPRAPSVVPVWYGAHLQEREVYDLMGIRFDGHPDMRRLLLYDGFPGHPLRKDWLNIPGERNAGLPVMHGEQRHDPSPKVVVEPGKPRPFNL